MFHHDQSYICGVSGRITMDSWRSCQNSCQIAVAGLDMGGVWWWCGCDWFWLLGRCDDGGGKA